MYGLILVVFIDVEAILRSRQCPVKMSVCFFSVPSKIGFYCEYANVADG